jgi:hypothetical protein
MDFLLLKYGGSNLPYHNHKRCEDSFYGAGEARKCTYKLRFKAEVSIKHEKPGASLTGTAETI